MCFSLFYTFSNHFLSYPGLLLYLLVSLGFLVRRLLSFLLSRQVENIKEKYVYWDLKSARLSDNTLLFSHSMRMSGFVKVEPHDFKFVF